MTKRSDASVLPYGPLMEVLREFEVPWALLAVTATDWIAVNKEEVVLAGLNMNGIVMENCPPKGCDELLEYQFAAASRYVDGYLASR